MFADCKLKYDFFRVVKTELIKLARMAGVMHEADHAYSIRSTWEIHDIKIRLRKIYRRNTRKHPHCYNET